LTKYDFATNLRTLYSQLSFAKFFFSKNKTSGTEKYFENAAL
jgi:hypothetical protein